VRGTWYSGTLGNEQAVRKDAGSDIARLYDPLNCRIATNEELQKRPGRGTIALLEKHGYLDLRRGRFPAWWQNTPVQYVRAADKAAVKLPFGSREFNAAASYSDFRRCLPHPQHLLRPGQAHHRVSVAAALERRCGCSSPTAA
jgi:hypothetical protein